MLRNKKYLLIFLCIPAYACYLYVLFLFERTALPWSDLICFSGFIAAAVSILTIKNKAIKLCCLAGIHAALLLSAFFHPQGIYAAKQSIFAYLFFCAAALLLIACFTADKATESKNSGGKKTNKPGDIIPLKHFPSLFPAAFALFFAVILFTDNEPVKVALQTEGLYFLLLFLFFVFCCRRLSKENKPVPPQCKTAAQLLTVFSALNCGMYIFYFHHYNGSTLLLTFPLFLAAVVYFTTFPSARNTVFCFLMDN